MNKQWKSICLSLSYINSLVILTWCPATPVWNFIYPIIQKELVGNSLICHVIRWSTFWIESGFSLLNGFMRSVLPILVPIQPIYIRLKENHSTRDNMFTEFWWSETRGSFQRLCRFFMFPACLESKEHPNHHNNKTPVSVVYSLLMLLWSFPRFIYVGVNNLDRNNKAGQPFRWISF